MEIEEKLEKDMEKLNEKLDRILEILEKDVKKMSDHIDFVEQVYTHVKSPFLYLMDRVNNTFSPSYIQNG